MTSPMTKSWLVAALLAVACTSVSGGESDGSGVLTGAVSIGPICPVEREGEPCTVPPEVYAGVQVLVQSTLTGRIVDRIGLDDEGNYRAVLPTGSYRVGLEHELGIDRGNPQTRVVRIDVGSTVVENFEIDTGIR